MVRASAAAHVPAEPPFFQCRAHGGDKVFDHEARLQMCVGCDPAAGGNPWAPPARHRPGRENSQTRRDGPGDEQNQRQDDHRDNIGDPAGEAERVVIDPALTCIRHRAGALASLAHAAAVLPRVHSGAPVDNHDGECDTQRHSQQPVGESPALGARRDVAVADRKRALGQRAWCAFVLHAAARLRIAASGTLNVSGTSAGTSSHACFAASAWSMATSSIDHSSVA